MEKFQRKIKNEKKKENGITLIALVVTIIILLILAGVAINMALGDNGLFKKARDAVNTWKTAEEDERGILGEIDSFLDDNMNANKVKVAYNKRPMKLGENTIYGMNIDISVIMPESLIKEIKLGGYDEFKTSLQELVLGKSDEELEEILDILIRNNQENSEEPRILSLEDYYEYYGVTNLLELANAQNLEEAAIENYGVNTIQEALICHEIDRLLDNYGEAMPYYRLEVEEDKIVCYKIGYEITPLDENVTGIGSTFTVGQNGTYKFKVKIKATGEEIEVEVPVTEITMQQGTEYENIINELMGLCGLKNKETGNYATFGEAYAIYNGEMFDITDVISETDERDRFGIDSDYDGYLYSYIDEREVANVIRNEIGKDPQGEGKEKYTVIIIKDNKSYIVNMAFMFAP